MVDLIPVRLLTTRELNAVIGAVEDGRMLCLRCGKTCTFDTQKGYHAGVCIDPDRGREVGYVVCYECVQLCESDEILQAEVRRKLVRARSRGEW